MQEHVKNRDWKKIRQEALDLLAETEHQDPDAPDAKERMEDIDWDDAPKNQKVSEKIKKQEEEKRKLHAEKKKLARKKRNQKKKEKLAESKESIELKPDESKMEGEAKASSAASTDRNKKASEIKAINIEELQRKKDLKDRLKQRRHLNQAKEDPRVMVPVVLQEQIETLNSMKENIESLKGLANLMQTQISEVEALIKKKDTDTLIRQAFTSTAEFYSWRQENPDDIVLGSKAKLTGPDNNDVGSMITYNSEFAENIRVYSKMKTAEETKEKEKTNFRS